MKLSPREEIARKRRKNEKKYDYFIQIPDGGRKYILDRKTKGRDGGHSRITKLIDANENTLEVKHEAWHKDQNPDIDEPYHTHLKSVVKRVRVKR